ncbi:hypothetical protein FRC00_007390 [Tulasnella sp. 408]|nr:hypothetical protein FRC00_007390 [Tulasnella sp. 408]
MGFGSGQAWLQRKTAGEELVRIVTKKYLGDVAVARRFTRSLDRQKIGLCAILLLCGEEENSTEMDFPVSDVLGGGIEYGYRGIIFLATSIPDFFTRVDPALVTEYAMRAINNASYMSLR